MTDASRGSRAIVLAAIIACIIASLGAKGEQGNAPGLKVAVFDRFTLMTQYKYTVDTQRDLNKKREDAITTLQVWSQNPLLKADEQQTLGKLTLEEKEQGDKFEAGKKAQMKKLLDQSKSLLEEYTRLTTVPQTMLTPDDKARIQTLTRLSSDTKSAVEDRDRQLTQEIQGQEQAMQTKIIKDVRDGIAKVAKDKGFNLVITNEMAWYGDNDVTEQVLAHLNKK